MVAAPYQYPRFAILPLVDAALYIVPGQCFMTTKSDMALSPNAETLGLDALPSGKTRVRVLNATGVAL
jgi:hypothetical protein